MKWMYGVTTVPSRRTTLLPRTLKSLEVAGFDRPHLFVDGEADPNSYRREFDLDVTAHYPSLGPVGNWITSLWALYLLDPNADRFAIFQDDIVSSLGLKDYLDSVEINGVYLNLYTAMDNERVIETVQRGKWVESKILSDNHPPTVERWQNGRGALGLVFDRSGVYELLSSKGVARKPLDNVGGKLKIDGMVVAAMNVAGYREMIHAPSLIQHTGGESTLSDKINRFPEARSFMGETFDLRGYKR